MGMADMGGKQERRMKSWVPGKRRTRKLSNGRLRQRERGGTEPRITGPAEWQSRAEHQQTSYRATAVHQAQGLQQWPHRQRVRRQGGKR